MPVLSLDWQKIAALLSGDTALYALTDQQATMLLGIGEQLHWRKSWRVDDYDFADWDTLQAEVDDLLRGLSMPVYVADLIQSIDAIAALLATAESCCQETDATEGWDSTDVVIDGVGDVPQPIIDAGYATDAADWAGFDDYKCMILHYLLLNVIVKLSDLATIVSSGSIGVAIIGAIVGILGALFAAPAFVVLGGILASAGTAAKLYQEISEKTGAQILGFADDLQAEQQAHICAMYAADGADAVLAAFYASVDDLHGAAVGAVVRLLNLRPLMRALYAGRYDTTNVAQRLADAGADPADYDCSGCGSQYGEYLITFTQSWPTSDQHPTIAFIKYGAQMHTPWTTGGNPAPCAAFRDYTGVSYDGELTLPNEDLTVLAGVPANGTYKAIFKRIEFQYSAATTPHANPDQNAQVTLYGDGAVANQTWYFKGAYGTWSDFAQTPDPAGYLVLDGVGFSVFFGAAEETPSRMHLVDNLKIWFDIEPV